MSVNKGVDAILVKMREPRGDGGGRGMTQMQKDVTHDITHDVGDDCGKVLLNLQCKKNI